MEDLIRAYREAAETYHKARAYTKEMRERAEQAREREKHLEKEQSRAYYKMMREIVGEEIYKREYAGYENFG